MEYKGLSIQNAGKEVIAKVGNWVAMVASLHWTKTVMWLCRSIQRACTGRYYRRRKELKYISIKIDS